jgi:hypothetical protein
VPRRKPSSHHSLPHAPPLALTQAARYVTINTANLTSESLLDCYSPPPTRQPSAAIIVYRTAPGPALAHSTSGFAFASRPSCALVYLTCLHLHCHKPLQDIPPPSHRAR